MDEFLASIENFSKKIPAIIRFDTSESTNYTFCPMKLNEIAYYQKWNLTKLEILQENIELSVPGMHR